MSNSTANSTYYGPTDTTPYQLFFQKTFLHSGYLTGIGFGFQFVLYIACMRILWKKDKRSRFTYFLLFYITFLCAMNATWTATSAYAMQLTFIDNINYPDGQVNKFLEVEFGLPSNDVCLSSYVLGNVLADGLLLVRCREIWAAYGSIGSRGDVFMVFPALLLLASLVMGTLFVIKTASPSGLYGGATTLVATPYFAISLSLNIILTVMIASRLYYYQRLIQKETGKRFGTHYTSITTMFVESAAVYCIVAILLLITWPINNPINQIWLGIAPSVQLVTSYLIIYRVAEGRAWRSDTLKEATSTMRFANSHVLKAPIDVTATFQTSASLPSTRVGGLDIQQMLKEEKSDLGSDVQKGKVVGEIENAELHYDHHKDDQQSV